MGARLRGCLVEELTDDSLPKLEVTRGLALESLGQGARRSLFAALTWSGGVMSRGSEAEDDAAGLHAVI